MRKPEYTLGDLIDRLSILTRKIHFNDEQSISEHRYLEQGLKFYGINGKLVTNVMRLIQMNIEIWNLENDMRRSGKVVSQMTDEELKEQGKRAVMIRDLNKKRIEYKNLLTELHKNNFKESFKEKKINHRSED